MRIYQKDLGDKTENLLEILNKDGVFISASCGGNGLCGKCRVRFLEGAPEENEFDKKVFSEDEINNGWRLACRAQVSGRFEMEINDSEDEMVVEADAAEKCGSGVKAGSSVIAVDIGTTTIAASLVDTETKEVVDTQTCVNHQRSFGADVISRIQASNAGKGELLKDSVEKDLKDLAERLGKDPESTEMLISGNTTMQHLLLGLSCESLGVAPYTPIDISLHKEGSYLVLPGISTYVGADIVSGIVACGMDQKDEITMLVDLGTNGEMAIGNKERILCASTAAGPAFEGGNISCGVAGVPGAVDSVTIRSGIAKYTTIGDRAPVGLCGTGVIEIMNELVQNEIVDETGLLDDDYFDSGYEIAPNCIFTQDDVREVQLAKAAIRAGLETLIEEYGTDYDGIDTLYIAGGFGRKIDLEKAVGVGLIPKELLAKCKAVGNSSLQGAVLLAKEPGQAERFKQIAEGAQETSLSQSALFSEYYMDHMFFPEVE